MNARGTALLTAALLLLLAGALFRKALFGGEVLSAAGFLLKHPPWSADAPAGVAPGNPTLADQATQFQPWALIAQRQLDSGLPPLWNPFAACGQPLLANMQSALLSPFATWLHLLPFGAALLAIALSKLLLAGLGTALLARRLGCSAPASALAGLAFAFGGYQFLWLGHPHSSAAALLPLLLLLVERWQDEGARGWLPALWALAVAALLLCGHPETALHAGLAAGLWAVLRGAARPARERLARLGGQAAWALAGAAVAGVQLVPFVEYLRLSEAYALRAGFGDLWHALPWRVLPLLALAAAGLALAWRTGRATARAQQRGATGRALLLAAALALLGAAALALLDAAGLSPLYRLLWWPDAFGHPLPERGLPFDAPRAYVNINGGYAGLVTLPLAFVGALCAARRPALPALRWLWLVAFVLGFEAPLLSHALGRLPLLDLALNYRFTLVVGLAGALLAGFGLDALARPATRRRPLATALLLLAALAAGVALAPRVPLPRAALPEPPRVHGFPVEGAPPATAPVQARWPALAAAAALLLAAGARRRAAALSPILPAAALLLLGADLYLFGRGFNPSAPAEQVLPPTRVTDWLRAEAGASRVWAVGDGLLPPETAGVYGLADVRGYDALGIDRYALFRALLAPPRDGARTPAPGEDLDLTHPLFGLLDVACVLALPDWAPPPGAALSRALDAGTCVTWRNNGWRARAFVAGEALDIRPYLAAAPARPELSPAAAARLHALNVGRALAEEFRAARDPARCLALEGDATRAGPAGADFSGSVRALDSTPLRQLYEVQASAPGWLCVTDAFHPGWTARVDGRETGIIPAFFAFRAVPVPAGTSRVELHYEPASLRWGAALTAAGLLALALGTWRARQARA